MIVKTYRIWNKKRRKKSKRTPVAIVAEPEIFITINQEFVTYLRSRYPNKKPTSCTISDMETYIRLRAPISIPPEKYHEYEGWENLLGIPLNNPKINAAP